MAKMRVSQHSGRSGSARHNDRSFLDEWSDQKRKEMAPHIREDATQENQTWCWQENVPFREAELNFYHSQYSAAIEATNARYRVEGHADRCKTVEDVYQGKLTRPEEMIIQIGDKNCNVSGQDFIACVNAYLEQINQWNNATGNHMHLLNVAVHLDETSPHAHIRRVWDYVDEKGMVRLGQGKALEAVGIALPDETKPVGRYNNRKMTFDAMARAWWQDICIEHGYDIETTPRPDRRRHKDTESFIDGQIAEKEKLLESTQKSLDEATSKLAETEAEADQLVADAAAKADQTVQDAQERVNSLQGDIIVLETKKGVLGRSDAPKPLDVEVRRTGFGKTVTMSSEDYQRILRQFETDKNTIQALRDNLQVVESQLAEAVARGPDIIARAEVQAASILEEAKLQRDSVKQELSGAREELAYIKRELVILEPRRLEIEHLKIEVSQLRESVDALTGQGTFELVSRRRFTPLKTVPQGARDQEVLSHKYGENLVALYNDGTYRPIGIEDNYYGGWDSEIVSDLFDKLCVIGVLETEPNVPVPESLFLELVQSRDINKPVSDRLDLLITREIVADALQFDRTARKQKTGQKADPSMAEQRVAAKAEAPTEKPPAQAAPPTVRLTGFAKDAAAFYGCFLVNGQERRAVIQEQNGQYHCMICWPDEQTRWQYNLGPQQTAEYLKFDAEHPRKTSMANQFVSADREAETINAARSQQQPIQPKRRHKGFDGPSL